MSLGSQELSEGAERAPAEVPFSSITIDYRQLVENLAHDHFLYVHDQDGVFTYVSPSIQKILGYTPEQFLTHYSRYMTDHPANREVEAYTAATLRGERSAPYRLQITHADGAARWIEVSENALRDAEGQIVGVQGLAADITDRILAEEKLLESEARFKIAFHTNMILATLSTLPEGTLVEANAAWLNFFGLDREAALGMPLTDLPVFANRTVYDRFVEALLRDGSIPETELVFQVRDGEPRTVIFSAERVLIGDRLYALALAKDISDRKAAEKAMRQQEERLRMAMEAGGMASWEWDVPTGRIRYSESASLVARGTDLEPYAGVAILMEMLHPEDREAFQRAIEDSAQRGEPFQCEYRVLMHDGAYHWILGKGRVVETVEGRPVKVLGVSADITDRKRVEEDRQRLLEQERVSRLEAETLARDREEFLSVAAHELKTPLAALMLQVEGMQRLLAKGNTEPQGFAKGLEISGRQVQRLVRLVTSLLDLTRLRQGRFELNRVPLDLVPLVAGVLQRFDAMMRSAQCPVVYSGDASLMGCWDADRLEQVIENILSNAAKYGRGSAIEIVGSGFEGTVVLSVRDHGIGIPEEEPERIFKPYERAGAELHYGGMGMGLYITREIVVAHGGTISAERMGDGGTLFTVTLPR